MSDVSYRRSQLDQATQRLDVSRYLAGDLAEDPARQACGAQRVAAGFDGRAGSSGD